jgi:hypothetical protein
VPVRSTLAVATGAALTLSLLLWPVAGNAAQSVPLTAAGANFDVQLERRAFRANGEPLLEWVRRSADIVSRYYDRFPSPTATVHVVDRDGDGVGGGTTWANPHALIRVQVGRAVTDTQLLTDWVLVHEMTHLALPDTGEEHAWFSEGLATYVEGIARVQSGNRTETDMWAEELRSMPRGLPQSGDAGLDHTHTWGRTYWGGAMFCLLADVDIRKRTQLRFGLQQALRAVLRASGGLSADWPIERVLRTGDAAVGTTSLEDLYAQMKHQPVTPDLLALWRELGVTSDGVSVHLNDQAPLAGVRHAIMRAPQ